MGCILGSPADASGGSGRLHPASSTPLREQHRRCPLTTHGFMLALLLLSGWFLDEHKPYLPSFSDQRYPKARSHGGDCAGNSPEAFRAGGMRRGLFEGTVCLTGVGLGSGGSPAAQAGSDGLVTRCLRWSDWPQPPAPAGPAFSHCWTLG